MEAPALVEQPGLEPGDAMSAPCCRSFPAVSYNKKGFLAVTSCQWRSRRESNPNALFLSRIARLHACFAGVDCVSLFVGIRYDLTVYDGEANLVQLLLKKLLTLFGISCRQFP